MPKQNVNCGKNVSEHLGIPEQDLFMMELVSGISTCDVALAVEQGEITWEKLSGDATIGDVQAAVERAKAKVAQAA